MRRPQQECPPIAWAHEPDEALPAAGPHTCPQARAGHCMPAPAAHPFHLDETDAQILRLLQADGRIPNLKLAQAVGLSAAAAHERVRRLTREGFILGYEAVLNPALLSAALLVFAEVRLETMERDLNAAFKAAVQAREEILECHEVAGDFDYLIKTRVADMNAYRDLVASVVWSLPGVRAIRTYAVMEEVKNTARITF
jgi:Lrp/AsnC family leucine-responsive transcriptional regulator